MGWLRTLDHSVCSAWVNSGFSLRKKKNEVRNKDLLTAKLVKPQNRLRIWGFPCVSGFNKRLDKYFI